MSKSSYNYISFLSEIDTVLKILTKFPPCDMLIRNALSSYLDEPSSGVAPKHHTRERLALYPFFLRVISSSACESISFS